MGNLSPAAIPHVITGSPVLADYEHATNLYHELGYVEDAPAGYDVLSEYGAWGADPDDASTSYTATLIWVQVFGARTTRKGAVAMFGEDQVEAAEAAAADAYHWSMT